MIHHRFLLALGLLLPIAHANTLSPYSHDTNTSHDLPPAAALSPAHRLITALHQQSTHPLDTHHPSHAPDLSWPSIHAQSALDASIPDAIVTLGDAHASASFSRLLQRAARATSRRTRRTPPHLSGAAPAAHRSYSQPGATIVDLGAQLARWRAFDAQHASAPAAAAALSVGLHDLGLGGACVAAAPEQACARAVARARAALDEQGARPESFRNSLENALFKTFLQGRAGAPGFRVYVAGYPVAGAGASDAPLGGLVRGLNDAIRKSVRSVNEDWGSEIAVFVGGAQRSGWLSRFVRRWL